jgi:hypothetical protein
MASNPSAWNDVTMCQRPSSAEAGVATGAARGSTRG